MSKQGPLILIEDDQDDYEIFQDVLVQLNISNKVIWFSNCIEAMRYLVTTEDQPFLIFCDVNLPIQSGIEFKKQIDEDKKLREKSIPFIFYSTSVDQHTVNTAYTEMTIQGFFQKASTYDKMKETIRIITDYWKLCKHPNCN